MALEQPKKPVGGAFGIFMAEKRAGFMSMCQGKPVSAVQKMGGEAWGKLSDDQKKPYGEKFLLAKAEYEKKMKAFLDAGGIAAKGVAAQRTAKRKEKEGKKAIKDVNKPKKPAGGGYGVFLSQERENIAKSLPASHKMTDVGKAAGERWRSLSEEAKKPYNDVFEKKMETYRKAMESYTPSIQEKSEEDQDIAEEGGVEPSPKKRPAAKVDGRVAKAARLSANAKTEEGKTAPRAAARGKAVEDPPLDAAVVARAKELKLDSALCNLAGRPEMKGMAADKMLKALEGSSGLVNGAKRALLGA